MMMLGKDYIDNGIKSPLSLHEGSLPRAYDTYFLAKNVGYYRIAAIAGGGGGVYDIYGSSSYYGRAGKHGAFVQGHYWIDRETIKRESASARWCETGAGGSRSEYPNNASPGGVTMIANGGTSRLISLNGGAGATASPSTNPSVSDAGTSPWTTNVGGGNSYGKGGNGAQFGGGRFAQSGSVGRIEIQRIW